MHKFLLAAVVALLFVPGMATADEEGPWSGKIAFGYLGVDGNTESEALNTEAVLKWDRERWHHTLSGRAVGQKENKETTAEAYKASYEANFDMTDRTYLFGLLDYNKNRFSSYDQQIFEVVGIGRRFIMTEKHKLNAEVGVGATQNDLVDGTKEDEFTTRISGDYTWKISENATFVQTLATNWSNANTYTESVTELRAGIIGDVGMALSYTVKHNSDVLPGTEKTDTWTAINIDYEF